MPKITEKDFGKKMRCEYIHHPRWFIPLAFNPLTTKDVIGVMEDKASAQWGIEMDWKEFEEPKKKVIKRMSSALIKYNDIYTVSSYLYCSEDEAKRKCSSSFIKWPANDTSWVEVEVEE